MNEQVARQVVLMRAIESTDTHHELLSEDDRRFATRSARELAQWRASEGGKRSPAEHFLEQRAEQIVRRLGERHPAFAAAVQPRSAGRGFTVLLALAAFCMGAVVDRIGDPGGVDLLSPPLLGILGWNLLMYLVLLLWAVWPGHAHGWATPRLTRWLVAQSARAPRRVPKVLGIAWTAFAAEWQTLSAGLNRLRLSRAMHVAAAAFALGAMLSLYARGILQNYAPSWESTFLDAGQVHHLLTLLFAPAMALFPIQGFTLADVQRLGMGAPALPGEGARWVHLYAATLLLLVVLPRLLLALLCHARARWLQRHFPLVLSDPYFTRLSAGAGPAAIAAVRVLPYSYELDELRLRGLDAAMRELFGEDVRVMVRPSLRYGEEPKLLLRDLDPADKDIGATVLLFSLAATPERENHGACMAALATAPGAHLTVLLDGAPLADRGPVPEARVALWRDLCKAHGLEPVVVNLAEAAKSGPAASPGGAHA